MPTTPILLLVTPAAGSTAWNTALDTALARIDTLFTKTGATAPASTPDFVNQLYYDSSTGIAYMAVGTSSSADWIPLGQLLGTTIEGAPVRNGFRNGAWNVWRRKGGKTSWLTADLGAGARTFFADGWSVQSGGGALASVTQGNIASYSGGFASSSTLKCCVLAGGAATTTVDVGQRMRALRVAAFKGKGATFVFRVWNGSGGAFTPNLILSTPSSGEDNWGSSADVATLPLQSCPNNAWTAIGAAITAATFDAYANIKDGFGARLQIPSGSLTTGKTVVLAEMLMDPGNVLRTFDTIPQSLDEQLCDEYFHPFIGDSVNDPVGGGGGWHAAGGLQFYTPLQFRVRMWKTPSVSFDSAGKYKVFSGAESFTPSAMACPQISRMGALVRATTSFTTVGTAGYLAWGAAPSYIDFDAEL